MDKSSLPLSYYLNNGAPDKTGYQQLAFSAIHKAVHFHPKESRVTLGPNAQNFNSSSQNQPIKPIDGSANSQDSKLPISVVKKPKTEKSPDSEDGYVCVSPEELQDKYLRKKIVASLENICLAESQEKIAKMTIEWMRREENTFSRLQGELDVTTRSLEDKMMNELKRRDIRILETTPDTLPFNVDKLNTMNLPTTPVYSVGTERIPDDHSTLSTTETTESLQPDSSLQTASQDIPSDMMQYYKEKFSPYALGIQNHSTQRASLLLQTPENPPQHLESSNHSTVVKPISDITKSVAEPLANKEDKKDEHCQPVSPKIETNEETQKQKHEPLSPLKEEASMEEEIVQDSKPTKKSEVIDPDVERIQSIMEHYKKYQNVYNETTKSLKSFMANDSLKKFRAECQKAVNVPVNAISGVSAAHLTDKLKKLTTLLSGGQVLVNNKAFNPSHHPLATLYCTYLLAEKIVRQGEDAVSVKSDSAFPIALIVLEIWDLFPLFGELLVGVFHKVCPYLIPIYWIKEDNMTEEEYYKKLGFKYAENERENIDMFLKRQGGVVRLYFSIIVSQMKNKYRTHPLHLNEAWRWLAMFTSQDPSAEITATLLYDMLDVCGHALFKTYGKQFLKIIHLICVQYVPKIEKVTPEGKGGPVSRLKSFLEDLIRTKDIKPPKGMLPPNFW